MAAIKASIGSPAELDLSHYRNDSIDDFEIQILNKSDNTPVDLSIYDAIEMQVKNDKEESSSTLEFTKLAGSILWAVDSNGTETGTGVDGKITLRKNMTEMEVLGEGSFVFDIQFIITASNKRRTLVKGTIVVEADTTR